MIPVRLTILLIGVLVLFLIAVGNPRPVALNLLFWSGSFALYKIIIGAVALGAILALIYVGHVRYLRRVRSGRFPN